MNEQELRRVFRDGLSRLSPSYLKEIHSPVEYGRDIVAVFPPYMDMYQVKAGNINTGTWEQQIEPQIRKMFTVPLGDALVDEDNLKKRGNIVFSGTINVYADRPISSLRDYYLKKFGWDVTFWDITRLVNFFTDNQIEDVLIDRRVWYELQTLIGRMEECALKIKDFDRFVLSQVSNLTHFSHESFRIWLVQYLLSKIESLIQEAGDDEALRSFHLYYKAKFLELGIALFELDDDLLPQYFDLSNYADIVLTEHKFIGAPWPDFEELTRSFPLRLLLLSARSLYCQGDDSSQENSLQQLVEVVDLAFENLWFYPGNIGRNFNANVEELETISWFAAPLLALFRTGKIQHARRWLDKIGEYLTVASQVSALDEVTCFANFAFLEYLIVFHFQDLFAKYGELLVSQKLAYTLTGQVEAVVFPSGSLDQVAAEYRTLWPVEYLRDFDQDTTESWIKLAFGFRGAPLLVTEEYLPWLIRREFCL